MKLRLALSVLCTVTQTWGGPRLNEVQVIGTHNSYHIAPHPSLATLIRSHDPAAADSLDYTHRPLAEQFDRLGIRQIELDLYADPEGGRFSQPLGLAKATEHNLPPPPVPDASMMGRPGIKVLHVPDVDYQTTVASFAEALQQVRDWSHRNPAHVPILVLLELKSEGVDAGVEVVPWDETLLASMEQEILQVFPREQILAPDEVRGKHPTLREAILQEGWPELGAVRGKVMFALDNTDRVRDLYVGQSQNLSGKLLFVSVAETHPAAAWFKLNDAREDFERIQRLVAAGFMVRTRADAGTTEARQQDHSRRERAFSSGAHFISTDYPEPQPSWGTYSVRWTNQIVARANPVSAPKIDASIDLEALAIPALTPFIPRELELLNARGFQFHGQRRLSDASADYNQLLSLDPPPAVDADRRAAVLAFAPVLRLVEGEPFELEHLVAIHHPAHNLIAYHLFWDDDIDYPDDNDPTDHEVVWVEYDPSNLQTRRLYTYFHGQIHVTDSMEKPPVFAIEWGKHGSLPFRSSTDGAPVHVEALRENWARLARSGTRKPDSPLAKGWPRRFDGDFAAYAKFPTALSTQSRLLQSDAIFVTRWANATIDRHALAYNFAAKIEWPMEAAVIGAGP